MSFAPTKYRLSVAEFQRMGEAGIFPPEKRVELIAGEIIEMSPIGSRHAAYVKRLRIYLEKQLAGRYLLGIQDPIQLSDSQPQPDLAILHTRADFYEAELPSAADTLLIVEVSDSTLDYDREVKLPLYAQAGIPEVWIVNLIDEQIEINALPTPADGFLQTRILGRNEIYRSLAVPELELETSSVWAKP